MLRSHDMKSTRLLGIAVAAIGLLLASLSPASAKTVKEYETQYSSMLEGLRAELKAALPQVDPAKQRAFEAAVKGKDKKKKLETLNALGLASFLAGGTLDAQLAQCVVLADGTPEGLAEFAAKGEQQAALLDALLADTELMKLMLMADGPNAPRVGRGYGPAQYGPAMEIYTGIQKTAVT